MKNTKVNTIEIVALTPAQKKAKRIAKSLIQGRQLLTHVNNKGATQPTQLKHIISKANDLPTINYTGNNKLQQANGTMRVLTYARLGQYTKDQLTIDGYKFPQEIPKNVCVNCSQCKGVCFNKKLYFRDNTINNRINNYLHSVSPDFVVNMMDILNKYEVKFSGDKLALRVHVEGEITDFNYMTKLFAIARFKDQINFYTYTKNYDLMLEYSHLIPKNFNIMISSWDNMPVEDLNKVKQLELKGFKIYHARTKGSPLPAGYKQCKDNCNQCHNCILGLNNASCEIH